MNSVQLISEGLVARTPMERALFFVEDGKRSSIKRTLEKVALCAVAVIAALSIVFLPLVIVGILAWQKVKDRISYYSKPFADPIDPALRSQKALVCKVGNSHLVAAVFEGDKITQKWRFDYQDAEWQSRLRDALASVKDVSLSLIGSVNSRVQEAVNKIFAEVDIKPLELDITQLKLTFNHRSLKADKPEDSVGADLIANAYAALKLCPQRNVIIADIGTALTVTPVAADHDIKTVYIDAGIGLKTKAFFGNTDLVYTTSQEPASRFDPQAGSRLPSNTVQCIADGVYGGLVGAIQGLVHLCQINTFAKPDEQPVLIATGGITSDKDDISGYRSPNNLSDFLRKDLQGVVKAAIIEPDLTLIGLHEMALELASKPV